MQDRRSFLLTLLLTGFPRIHARQTPGPSGPAIGWTQFRGDPRLTGVASSPLSDDLKLLWTHEAADAIESSAAIAGGVAFVGSATGEIIAVDLQTGRLRWTYKAGEAIGESSPAVHDGIVYVGDLEGTVHAVDGVSGRRQWTFKTGGEVKASPVVTGDLVLVGSYDTHLYALEAKSGALKWKFKTEGPVHATAAVADGMAYIAGCDERFRAIRIADGSEAFHIVSGAYTGASPAISGRAAFFGTFNNEVLRLDLVRRRVAWSYQDPKRQFPFYSSAAIADGRVVVGGRDKVVHCLEADTGRRLWRVETRARVDSSPAIAGSRVYVGSNDGRVYGLDLASGRVVWEFQAGAPISASPAIAAGRLVIGAQDGRLYCFG